MSKEIKLQGKNAQGRSVIVSDCDYEWASTHAWGLKIDSRVPHVMYARTRIPGKNGQTSKQVYLHRMIIGDVPNRVVDHLNRNTLDNRRENLRHATYSESTINRGITQNNHGVGVTWKGKKWQAGVTYKRKYYYLGMFEDLSKAMKASLEKRKELGIVY